MYFVVKLLIVSLLSTNLLSSVTKELPYPKTITADEIAKQIYFVNHQLYLNNQLIEAKGKGKNKKSILIVKKNAQGKVTYFTLNRYFINNCADKSIRSKDMIIFTSGKIKGLGVLMKEYTDEKKSVEVTMYFPALRKTRRMAEPTKGSTYGAADIAFLEEIKTRHLSDETNELLSTEEMTFNFEKITLSPSQLNRYTKNLPQTSAHKKAKVYVLKVLPTKQTWYDYRIDYTDTKYFHVHKTEFYKDKKIIKTVERQWKKLKGFKDRRAYMWDYWYTRDEDGQESVYYIPAEIVQNNDKKIKEKFWRDATLRKIKR